jgi:hypothetical protein
MKNIHVFYEKLNEIKEGILEYARLIFLIMKHTIFTQIFSSLFLIGTKYSACKAIFEKGQGSS